MAKMTDLLYHIQNIVPQPLPMSSVSAADGLYTRFYAPIEAYDPLSETVTVAPILSDMSQACDYLVGCFDFGRMAMLSDYIRDLFFFRLICVCGARESTGSTGTVAYNEYQDILDEIEARWVNYTFKLIDTYMTFAMIKEM